MLAPSGFVTIRVQVFGLLALSIIRPRHPCLEDVIKGVTFRWWQEVRLLRRQTPQICIRVRFGLSRLRHLHFG